MGSLHVCVRGEHGSHIPPAKAKLHFEAHLTILGMAGTRKDGRWEEGKLIAAKPRELLELC